eukprot:2210062-Rhodomonas_salina.6
MGHASRHKYRSRCRSRCRSRYRSRCRPRYRSRRRAPVTSQDLGEGALEEVDAEALALDVQLVAPYPTSVPAIAYNSRKSIRLF